MKRTAMPARTTPLPRAASMKRTGRLRYRSPKMAALYRNERVPLVRRILAENPWCQLRLPGCTGLADTVHELLPRGRGGSITDPTNTVSACRSCNDGASNERITEAHARVLLRHSWDRGDTA